MSCVAKWEFVRFASRNAYQMRLGKTLCIMCASRIALTEKANFGKILFCFTIHLSTCMFMKNSE